jgi:hypothetical protein
MTLLGPFGRGRPSRGLLALAVAAGGLAVPRVTASAGPCGWLVGVSTWTGNLSLSYSAAYVEPLEGARIETSHGADATFELSRFGEGPGGISWSGLAVGTGRTADRSIAPDPPPNVTTLDGGGSLLPAIFGEDTSRVTLNVNLDTCEYNFAFSPAIDLVEISETGTRTEGAGIIGSVRTGNQGIPGAPASLAGGGALTAHSVLWGLQHDGEAYFPRGLSGLVGIPTEIDAGSANVSWNFRPGDTSPLEVVVRPQGYDSWMPQGGINEDTEGNSIRVEAVLQKKGGGETDARAHTFTFELLDVSHEPGVCLNFPQDAAEGDKPDLRFRGEPNAAASPPLEALEGGRKVMTGTGSHQRATATVSAFDFGAFGLLRVVADTDAGPIVGHLEGDDQRTDVLLPKRQDGSQIADAWRARYGVNADDEDRDAEPAGNGVQGDWLSAYEEYRGFFVGEAPPGGLPHIRTDPNKKDLFVRDLDNLGPGDLTTANLGAPVHYLDDGQTDADRRVNPHAGIHHLHDQKAVHVWNGHLAPTRTLGHTLAARAHVPVNEVHCIVYVDTIAKDDECRLVADTAAGATTLTASCGGAYRPTGRARVGGESFAYSAFLRQSPSVFTLAAPLALAQPAGTAIALFDDPGDVVRKVFAHEVGHLVGLKDNGDGSEPGCDGTGQNVMSAPNCPGSVVGEGIYHSFVGTADPRHDFAVRE